MNEGIFVAVELSIYSRQSNDRIATLSNGVLKLVGWAAKNYIIYNVEMTKADATFIILIPVPDATMNGLQEAIKYLEVLPADTFVHRVSPPAAYEWLSTMWIPKAT
jgi:hypothetical protein